jgi:glycosyltransferase involved in cell wall biosynthesis
MSPKVSVLIPLYNSENYIEETLLSVFNQSYKNIEIIIVDDGSTDNSYNIAKKHECDNVKVIRQKNSGACRARNFAFECSSGDLIQYLDADDLLSKDLIKNKVKYFMDYGKNIVVTSTLKRFYTSINDSKTISEKIRKNYKNGIDLILDMAKHQQPSQVSSWLISRELKIITGNWNESLLRNQDGEMFIRLLLNCEGVYCSKESISYYRLVNNSLSSSFSKGKMNSLLYSYDLYKINILNKLKSNESKKAIQRFYLSSLLINKSIEREFYVSVLDKVREFEIRPSFGGHYLLRLFSKVFGIKVSFFCVNLIKKLR